MPLVSLQTRFDTVRRQAQGLRAVSAAAAARFAAQPVTAAEVVHLAAQMASAIADVSPHQSDAALSAKFDAEFGDDPSWPAGALPTLIGGVVALAGAVIGAAKATVPGPALVTWNQDGTTSSIMVQPAETAALVAYLNQILVAIPA